MGRGTRPTRPTVRYSCCVGLVPRPTLHVVAPTNRLMDTLAYKPNVDDVRESPSLELIKLLSDLGAGVDYHDPHCPETHPMRSYDLAMKSLPDDGLYDVLGTYDCVLIATDHSWYDWGKVHDSVARGEARGVVVDTRNAMSGIIDPDVIVRA